MLRGKNYKEQGALGVWVEGYMALGDAKIDKGRAQELFISSILVKYGILAEM